MSLSFSQLKLLILILLITACYCSKKNITNTKTDIINNYNLIITMYDSDIDNPDNDRRSYYEVFIDKAESGRSTIGLESQKKIFETNLTPDRHLIRLEKWVLDDSQGRYIKLNNIYQPKPDFIYVNIENKKTTKITVQSAKFGTTLYTSTTE